MENSDSSCTCSNKLLHTQDKGWNLHGKPPVMNGDRKEELHENHPSRERGQNVGVRVHYKHGVDREDGFSSTWRSHQVPVLWPIQISFHLKS